VKIQVIHVLTQRRKNQKGYEWHCRWGASSENPSDPCPDSKKKKLNKEITGTLDEETASKAVCLPSDLTGKPEGSNSKKRKSSAVTPVGTLSTRDRKRLAASRKVAHLLSKA